MRRYTTTNGRIILNWVNSVHTLLLHPRVLKYIILSSHQCSSFSSSGLFTSPCRPKLCILFLALCCMLQFCQSLFTFIRLRLFHFAFFSPKTRTYSSKVVLLLFSMNIADIPPSKSHAHFPLLSSFQRVSSRPWPSGNTL
jgi:hypothetical protein